MHAQKPTTRTMNISAVKSQLSSLVNAVSHAATRVPIEKSGNPVAAIVSPADLSRLFKFEQERDESFKIIDELREAFKDVPAEEIEREADRAVAELRSKTPVTV